MKKIIFLALIIVLVSKIGRSQCAIGVDTICLNVPDTLFINSQPTLTSYNWFTNNGATLNVQTGDTLVYVDWSTSSVSNGLDSVCLVGIIDPTCSDTICIVQYLEDCTIPENCPTVGLDTDNDGIPNYVDIDDDNDGILDQYERVSEQVSISGQPTTLNGVSITSTTAIANGDVLLISNVLTTSGVSVDLQMTISNITSGVTYNPTNGSLSLTPYNASADDLFEVAIVFVESGTSTPYQLDGVEIIFQDIDSQINRDFTEMIGLPGSPAVILGSSLSLQNYENGGGLSGYTNYGVSKTLNGSTTDWLDEINVAATDEDHFIKVIYSDISSLGFTYGVTGTQGISTGSRGASIANLFFFEGLDTDNDGVEDYLDLDSDNDGIPDVIEACGDNTLALEDCMLDSDGTAVYPDSDMNGCPDGLVSTACGAAPIDTDMDGLPDYLDLDSDGDGCADNTEAGVNHLGTSEDTYIAGTVDGNGLLTTGISGTCPIPTNIAYRDSSFNACFTCVLLTTDPSSFCNYVIANPMSPLASDDCDNGGIDNITECTNGGDPNDSCDDMPPIIVCPSNQILTEKGCEIILDDYTDDVNLIDACTDQSIYTFTQSPILGTSLITDVYTITVTVTDVNNNTATCTFLVEVNLIPLTVPTISGN